MEGLPTEEWEVSEVVGVRPSDVTIGGVRGGGT